MNREQIMDWMGRHDVALSDEAIIDLAALSASKAEAEDSELAERLRFGAANNGATLEAEECAALLSSPVPAITNEAVERAARMALMYLETGFMACDRCGHEMETKTTDACHELRTAFPSKGGE